MNPRPECPELPSRSTSSYCLSDLTTLDASTHDGTLLVLFAGQLYKCVKIKNRFCK